LRLRVDLTGASGQEAEVTVLDALGVAVANAVRVTGRFHGWTARRRRAIALGGRPDDNGAIAAQIDAQARRDPFGGCVVGYVLLRLGRNEWLGALSTAIIEAVPTLSDAYILPGEYEAYRQNEAASYQAFADAASAGVPVFAEGLTRLVEGLLASGFIHPGGALVRYIFQQHARGSMWAAFTPRGEFKPRRLVITGADIGYEG
jgi:hypothetical protein